MTDDNPGVPETGDTTAQPKDLQTQPACPACGVSPEYARHDAADHHAVECLACGTRYRLPEDEDE